MVTLGVLAILVGVATPAYSLFILNTRAVTQTNEFVLAMTYAKSEVVRRGGWVTVCARATDSTCATAANWDNGWLVFTDANYNGVVDGTDLVLQIRGPLEGGNTLRAGARAWVTFSSVGFIRPGNNDTFRLCDKRGTAKGEAVVMSLQGWLSTQVGTASCP